MSAKGEALRARILELHRKQLTTEQIAARVGKSRGHVRHVLQGMGVDAILPWQGDFGGAP